MDPRPETAAEAHAGGRTGAPLIAALDLGRAYGEGAARVVALEHRGARDREAAGAAAV